MSLWTAALGNDNGSKRLEGLPYLQSLRADDDNRQREGEIEVPMEQDSTFLKELATLRAETKKKSDLVDLGLAMSQEQHEKLMDEKVKAFTHKMTVTMQDVMKNKLQGIAQEEGRRLQQMQREVRDMLRYYHKNEGGIYDVCQKLRLYDEQVAMLEEERDQLRERQNQLKELFGEMDNVEVVSDEEEEEEELPPQGPQGDDAESKSKQLKLQLKAHTKRSRALREEVLKARRALQAETKVLEEMVAMEAAKAKRAMEEVARITDLGQNAKKKKLTALEKVRAELGRQNDLLAEAKSKLASRAEVRTALLKANEGLRQELFERTRVLSQLGRENDLSLQESEEKFFQLLHRRVDTINHIVETFKKMDENFRRHFNCPHCKTRMLNATQLWSTGITYCEACAQRKAQKHEEHRMHHHKKGAPEPAEGAQVTPKLQRNYLIDSFMSRYDLYNVMLQDMTNSASFLPKILKVLVLNRRDHKMNKGRSKKGHKGGHGGKHIYAPSSKGKIHRGSTVMKVPPGAGASRKASLLNSNQLAHRELKPSRR